MVKDKRSTLILVLIGIIAILIIILVYAFLIQPSLNGLVISGQNQGVQYTIMTIAQQAASCQVVPLTIGNETLDLVAVDCLPLECLQSPQE